MIVGLTTIIFGILVIVAVESLALSSTWSNVLKSIGTTLLIGGWLGLGYEFLLRKELLDEIDLAIDSSNHSNKLSIEKIERRLNLSKSIEELGLLELGIRESHFDYSQMIVESEELNFVFNDGRTWFSNHESDLHKRSEKRSAKTHIILIHPESLFLDALSVKVDMKPDEIRAKTQETVRMLSRMPWSDGDLRVYGHPLPTAFSLVMNEHQAVFIPYQMSRKAEKIPCFVFQSSCPDGFYHAIKRDVREIASSSRTKLLHPQDLMS